METHFKLTSDMSDGFEVKANYNDIKQYLFSHPVLYRPYKKSSGSNGRNFKSTWNILSDIIQVSGVSPSSEQYIYILSNKKRILNEACAGAGKTTMSRIKLMLNKITMNIPESKLLFLAYNKSAIADIESKYNKANSDLLKYYTSCTTNFDSQAYQTMVSRCNSFEKAQFKTFHAFSFSWVDTFLDTSGGLNYINNVKKSLDSTDSKHVSMSKLKVFSESEDLNLFRKAVDNCYNKQLISDDAYERLSNENSLSDLQSFYCYLCERLETTDYDTWDDNPRFKSLNYLTIGELKVIFNVYEKIIKLYSKTTCTYQSLPQRLYELLLTKDKNDKYANLELLRNSFSYILVDEYQDFTPLMVQILKLILQGNEELGILPYTDAYFVAIGDGDQSIYGFRGTDSDNCIRFSDDFKTAEDTIVTVMTINRRCRSAILDEAGALIKSNPRRIDKPVRWLYTGGQVSIHPFTNLSEEMKILCDCIDTDKFPNTCVSFRNRYSAKYTSLYLFNKMIPFSMSESKSVYPYRDSLCLTLNSVCELLIDPINIDLMREVLYKIFPSGKFISKSILNSILTKYESSLKSQAKQTNEFGVRVGSMSYKPFYELDFGQATNSSAFNEVLSSLTNMALSIRANRQLSMSTYMPYVFKYVMNNYINFISKNFQDSFSPEYVNYVYSLYCQDISYLKFKADIQNKRRFQDSSTNPKVILTTFHSLKGLEFDSVHLIDMTQGVFPTSYNDYSPIQQDRLELEDLRLMYVASTRPKYELHLYYDKNNPSYFMNFFHNSKALEVPETPTVEYSDIKEALSDNGFTLTDTITVSNNSNTTDDLNISLQEVSANDIALKLGGSLIVTDEPSISPSEPNMRVDLATTTLADMCNNSTDDKNIIEIDDTDFFEEPVKSTKTTLTSEESSALSNKPKVSSLIEVLRSKGIQI